MTISVHEARALTARALATKEFIGGLAQAVEQAARDAKTCLMVPLGREVEVAILPETVFPRDLAVPPPFMVHGEGLVHCLEAAPDAQEHFLAARDFHAAGYSVKANSSNAKSAGPKEIVAVICEWQIGWASESAQVRTSTWSGLLSTAQETHKLATMPKLVEQAKRKVHGLIRRAAADGAAEIQFDLNEVHADAAEKLAQELRAEGFESRLTPSLSNPRQIEVSW